MVQTNIKTVAVIGAGTMGQGIAQVCAQAGFTTLHFDINSKLLENAVVAIQNNLQTAIDKGKIGLKEKQETLDRITVAKNLKEVRADLIIEAVVENLQVKQDLFLELEKINSGKAILATNTSSLSVTQIACVLRSPDKCIGLHFFNPAHLMKLVEIISGEETSQELIEIMRNFTSKLEKISVIAKDSPGFIVNRVARPYYLESLKLLQDGVADIITIDTLLKNVGFKMGPFALMDLIGIDINLAVTKSVYNGFQQADKFRPSPIQQQKVDAGHLGRKSGKGFYEYPKN